VGRGGSLASGSTVACLCSMPTAAIRFRCWPAVSLTLAVAAPVGLNSRETLFGDFTSRR
jgi:hypothetical protein